jgi:hypothetical protein
MSTEQPDPTPQRHLPTDGLPEDAQRIEVIEATAASGYAAEDEADFVALNVLDRSGDAYTILFTSPNDAIKAGQHLIALGARIQRLTDTHQEDTDDDE